MHEAAPLVEIEFVQLLQDMLGDLEGNPEPIEVKIFGDDPERLAELAEPVEEMLSKIDGVVDVVGVQQRQPRGHVDDRSGGRRPLRADRRAGVGPDGRQLARRRGHRSAPARSHDSGARAPARRRSASIPNKLPAR